MTDASPLPRPRYRRFRWVAVGVVIPLLLLMLAWVKMGLGDGPYMALPASGPQAGRRDVAVVMISGDMGFRAGIAAKVAARIAQQGYLVFGINSFAVFRQPRRPEQISLVVRGIMTKALQTGARRVILVGQSYGADMLHVAMAYMPPAERPRVAMIALVVPTDTVYYRVSLGEFLEWTAPDAAAIETAKRLDWAPLLCIRGREEQDSLCPKLTQRNVHKVILPGGHPLHHDADAVARTLLGAFSRVATLH